MKRVQRFGFFFLLIITVVPVAVPAAAVFFQTPELDAADACWVPLSTAMLLTAAASLWLLDKGRAQKIAGLAGFTASVFSLIMISVYTWYTEAAEFITHVPTWISDAGGPIVFTSIPIAACCAICPLFWSACAGRFLPLRRALLLGILAASALIVFAAWTDRLIDSGSVLWQRIVTSGTIASALLYCLYPPAKVDSSLRCKAFINCPCCGLCQEIRDGRSCCARCHVQFTLTAAEPLCPSCSYNLRNLESTACPECGTFIAPL